MSEKPTIGFIGVGFMGHGLAANILKNGYPLVVKGNRNRTPVDDLVEKGAVEADTIRTLMKSAEIIHLCLQILSGGDRFNWGWRYYRAC